MSVPDAPIHTVNISDRSMIHCNSKDTQVQILQIMELTLHTSYEPHRSLKRQQIIIHKHGDLIWMLGDIMLQ